MLLVRNIKNKVRSISTKVSSFELPDFLTGIVARVVLSAFFLILAGAYIIGTNNLSTSGYEIHTLEQQVASLNTEVERLSTSLAGAQSMASIQKRLPETKMVAVANAKYIKIVPVVVAER